MFLYLFILLGAWEGLAEPTFTCDDSSFSVCAPPLDENERQFPSTKEEILKICPYFMEFQRCIRTYAEKCGEQSVNIINFSFEMQQRIVEVAEDICNEDSPLHSNVVEHIGCLRNVTEYSDCSEYARKKLQTVIDIITKTEENGSGSSTDTVWQSINCIFEIQTTVCFTAKTQEVCGLGAKDLIEQLLERTEYFEQYCRGTQPDEIDEIIEILKLDEEEQSALKEFINRE
ncbi:uncharacterized protein TNIN_61 [Trichonephila inaurata madagascariensis]|uniref:DUF19 domain-containing protein n=1 Tax=Trichonephila inaurata madagascariensis TaxID=2747483 RepID=A0A8X7BZK6_9ARAC|nr:uncharacterized protein TNIN_61 [Trichonephila inaurata madagascariensis]